MVGVICGVEFDRGEVYIDAFIFDSIDKELEFRCGERGDLCWIERFVEADREGLAVGIEFDLGDIRDSPSVDHVRGIVGDDLCEILEAVTSSVLDGVIGVVSGKNRLIGGDAIVFLEINADGSIRSRGCEITDGEGEALGDGCTVGVF